MNIQNLPYRLSERAFRRFESSIRLAVQSYPNPVIVAGNGLSSTTCEARLRDALASLRTFNWPCEWTSDLVFQTIDKLSVWSRNGIVRIGDYKHAFLPNRQQQIESKTENVLELSTYELTCFCVLVSNHKLNGPFRFRLNGPLADSSIKDLELSHDISITPENDYYILL